MEGEQDPRTYAIIEVTGERKQEKEAEGRDHTHALGTGGEHPRRLRPLGFPGGHRSV